MNKTILNPNFINDVKLLISDQFEWNIQLN